MTDRLNGRQMALQSLTRFKEWIGERDKAGDWTSHWKGDKLSRAEIATACGFGTSALRQNPAIKDALEKLEARLREEMKACSIAMGGLQQDEDSHTAAVDSDNAVAGLLASPKFGDDPHVASLRQENAALRAEIAFLNEKNELLQHLDAHLCETGRMVRV
ncbi:hypothetical protein [Noviherbaspirillum pedocola]|uniref:Uncharacterized protein n=1 Tax=Noviherbaspirillum pedocola TaxID=2801341 RepID=A0A934W1T0_9BURK|nr:hypothetical protein [Noviherbaspirillum pedocola]MBK4735536.1 hypothetical protein [Noviherbaspirillum pedocola]